MSGNGNQYNLTIVPQFATWNGQGTSPARPNGDAVLVWSTCGGFSSPPALASRVFALGGFGPSTVVGYFVEHGYLGVRLAPDQRPRWHVEQNPGRDVVMMFGAEIKPIDLLPPAPKKRGRNVAGTPAKRKPSSQKEVL